jgi:ABC-type transport system involved in cytochrome bd biosynthesis fused ATPase/permease subunit
LTFKSASGSLKPTLDLIDSLENVSPIKDEDVEFDDIHLGFKSKVSLKNITFCYPGTTQPALENISLDIYEKRLEVSINMVSLEKQRYVVRKFYQIYVKTD